MTTTTKECPWRASFVAPFRHPPLARRRTLGPISPRGTASRRLTESVGRAAVGILELLGTPLCFVGLVRGPLILLYGNALGLLPRLLLPSLGLALLLFGSGLIAAELLFGLALALLIASLLPDRVLAH